MTPHERRAAKARRLALDRAIEVLKQQPGFPSAQIQIHDRSVEWNNNLSPEESRWGTTERIKVVLQILDIRAEAYLALVSDMKTQEAFMAVLEEFGNNAWESYIGFPLLMAPPGPGDTQFLDIRRSVGRWINEGYKRLATAPYDEAAQSEHAARKDAPRDPTAENDSKTRANYTNIYFGPVGNSQFTQGSGASVQSLTTEAIDLTALATVIAELKGCIADLNLSQTDQQQIQANVRALQGQIQSPRPSNVVLNALILSITNIVEGCTGSIVAAGLLQKLSGMGG